MVPPITMSALIIMINRSVSVALPRPMTAPVIGEFPDWVSLSLSISRSGV